MENEIFNLEFYHSMGLFAGYMIGVALIISILGTMLTILFGFISILAQPFFVLARILENTAAAIEARNIENARIISESSGKQLIE